MDLTEVTLASLSQIKYRVLLPTGSGPEMVDFTVIEYSGTYRYGSAGHDDALFIMATTAAAHTAWYTPAIVVDLRHLTFRWGDEMEWIPEIGRPGAALVIVVGDGCRDALKTLLEDEFVEVARDTLEEAVLLVQEKLRGSEKCDTHGAQRRD